MRALHSTTIPDPLYENRRCLFHMALKGTLGYVIRYRKGAIIIKTFVKTLATRREAYISSCRFELIRYAS